MMCPDYRSALIELARGGAADPGLSRHLERCGVCSRFLEDQVALTVMFEEAALSDSRTIALPPELEARLLAEFDAAHAPVPSKVLRFRMPRRWVPVLAGSVAASLAIAWLLTQKPAMKPAPVKARIAQPSPEVAVAQPRRAETKPVGRRKPGVHATNRASSQAAQQMARPLPEPDTPFVEIPYTVPLAPYERASVMRMEMPVAALIAAGLPVRTANTDGRAQADVLVGEDGRAHAVRVISISSTYSQGGNNK
jgi:hypothetical protein